MKYVAWGTLKESEWNGIVFEKRSRRDEKEEESSSQPQSYWDGWLREGKWGNHKLQDCVICSFYGTHPPLFLLHTSLIPLPSFRISRTMMMMTTTTGMTKTRITQRTRSRDPLLFVPFFLLSQYVYWTKWIHTQWIKGQEPVWVCRVEVVVTWGERESGVKPKSSLHKVLSSRRSSSLNLCSYELWTMKEMRNDEGRGGEKRLIWWELLHGARNSDNIHIRQMWDCSWGHNQGNRPFQLQSYSFNKGENEKKGRDPFYIHSTCSIFLSRHPFVPHYTLSPFF